MLQHPICDVNVMHSAPSYNTTT